MLDSPTARRVTLVLGAPFIVVALVMIWAVLIILACLEGAWDQGRVVLTLLVNLYRKGWAP